MGKLKSIRSQEEIDNGIGEFLPPTPQEQIEYLESEVLRLQKELSECLPDTILLSYLNDLPNIPPGYGWKLYKSTTGRGWRLATVKPETLAIMGLTPYVYATPREAIRAEINLEIQLEEKETED